MNKYDIINMSCSRSFKLLVHTANCPSVFFFPLSVTSL